MKITQMIKKSLRKRIVSVVLVICMMCGLMLPLASVTVSAEAPATYSTITAGSTAYVSISTANDAKYFKFVPTQTGEYKFWSSDNTADTYGALLDSNGNSLISNDDGANNNNNFMFTYECTANTTYYVKAYMYSSNTGSYTLHVAKVGADPGVVPDGDMVDINATGTHSLFNSGATGQGYKYSSTQGSDANPNSHSYSNSGYDIYGQMNKNSTLTIGMGCSFTIHKEVTERATLTVYAYDVDEESGETDTVYLVDETDGTRTPVGTLKGMNDQ